MNNQPIGILDSGVGGLTVWKEIIKKSPHESTVYVGDSLNAPYGWYSAKKIHSLSRKLVEFLLAKKVKAIVVACNSITVTCLDSLRQEYSQVPIIGAVPVVKMATKVSRNKKIGILSTTKTAKSAYQKKLIKKFANGCSVFVHGTDELVPLIENGELEGKNLNNVLLKTLIKFKKEEIDTLALGCTHYPFVSLETQKILGKNVTLLDSGAAIARQVKRVLENNQAFSKNANSRHEFYTTGEKNAFTKVAKTLGKDTITQKIQKIKL